MPVKRTPVPHRTQSVRRVVVQDRTPLSGEMGGTRFTTTTDETRSETRADTRQRRAGSRRSRGGTRGSFPSLAGRASGGTLLAEYIFGAFVIIVSLITKGPNKGYLDVMSEVLVRLTALTAVFFVLFLFAGSENAGKAAAWFGLLIDLGILFTATAQGEIEEIANIAVGGQSGVDHATLLKSTTYPEPKPEQLPDE